MVLACAVPANPASSSGGLDKTSGAPVRFDLVDEDRDALTLATIPGAAAVPIPRLVMKAPPPLLRTRDCAALRSFAVSGRKGISRDDATVFEADEVGAGRAATTFVDTAKGRAARIPAEKIKQRTRGANLTRHASVTVADPSVNECTPESSLEPALNRGSVSRDAGSTASARAR
jgi:hypothetical protein